MKSGLALMLDLVEHDLAACQGVDLTLVFYAREEGPYLENELGPVLDADAELRGVDLAVCLEPSDNKLSLGASGSIHAVVTFEGRTAHSARPWQGENAIYRAIPLLERFAKLERRAVTFGELTFYEVFVVTQALTVNSKNVVPDALMLNVNVRFAPGNTAERAEAELRGIVGSDAHVEIEDRAPSGDVHHDHPLIRAWREAESLPVRPKQAWTDVARFTSHGIPAVNFGPGETAQAHQANEWCSIDSLEFCFGALRRFFSS
jgi:succinyl-diaminopimelate desuccinylase